MSYVIQDKASGALLAKPEFVGDTVHWIPPDDTCEEPWAFDTRTGAERARDANAGNADVMERRVAPTTKVGFQRMYNAWDVAEAGAQIDITGLDFAEVEQRALAHMRVNAAYVCRDFHSDRELPDYCEGCTRPRAEHHD